MVILTENPEEIATLLTHEDVFNDVINDECRTLDYAQTVKATQELLPTSLYFKVLSSTNKIVGLVSFHDDENEMALNSHCAFLKEFRGRFAMRAINKALGLVFQYTQYEKIWARFSSGKYHVLKLISRLGFKLDHLIEKDYPDQGVVYDTICMTLIKKDYNNA